MNEEQPDEDDPRIRQRLDDVLSSIMCPIAGCWPIHGAESALYFDNDTETYVLEVWPVGVEEPVEHEGNGHEESDLLYELAEFDFLRLVEEVPVERFHFSQREGVFEIGWKEFGHELELRVHLQPAEMDEEP